MSIVVKELFSDSGTQRMDMFHSTRWDGICLDSFSKLLNGKGNGVVNQARIYGGIGGGGVRSGRYRNPLEQSSIGAIGYNPLEFSCLGQSGNRNIIYLPGANVPGIAVHGEGKLEGGRTDIGSSYRQIFRFRSQNAV